MFYKYIDTLLAGLKAPRRLFRAFQRRSIFVGTLFFLNAFNSMKNQTSTHNFWFQIILVPTCADANIFWSPQNDPPKSWYQTCSVPNMFATCYLTRAGPGRLGRAGPGQLPRPATWAGRPGRFYIKSILFCSRSSSAPRMYLKSARDVCPQCTSAMTFSRGRGRANRGGWR